MARAKSMSRSRNQIASSYAPESFFTFEGGSGACIARATAGEAIFLAEPTLNQIFERINELGRAWFSAAMSARDNDLTKPRVTANQCVDPRLLDNTRSDFQAPGQDRVYLCKPSHMEYTPAPLTFVCRTCGLFRDYETLRKLDDALPQLSPAHCPNPKKPGRCDWEQLDVVFVHWSGQWEPAFPGQYQWSDLELKVVKRRDTCVCGSNDFRLNRRQAGIGDWFFECAKCDKPLSTKWRQNDQQTLGMIGPAFTEARRTEVSMQAAPYRASSVYYVKSDLFIDFKDGGQDLLSRLRPGREDALKDFVATRYGLGVAPLTDADVESACSGRDDCQKDLLDYRAAAASIKVAEEQIGKLEGPMRSMVQALLDSAVDNRRRIVDEPQRGRHNERVFILGRALPRVPGDVRPDGPFDAPCRHAVPPERVQQRGAADQWVSRCYMTLIIGAAYALPREDGRQDSTPREEPNCAARGSRIDVNKATIGAKEWPCLTGVDESFLRWGTEVERPPNGCKAKENYGHLCV